MDLSESDLRVSGCGRQEGPLRREPACERSGALTLALPTVEPERIASGR